MTDQSSSPRDILAQAVDALENKQDAQKAADLSEQSFAAAVAVNDFATAGEALSQKAIALNRLFRNTGERVYLEQVLDCASRGVEMAEKSGESGATLLPLLTLAKAQAALENFAEAVDTLDKAITIMQKTPPEKFRDRLSILHDMQAHRESFAYQNGDKTAIDRLEEAAKALGADADAGTYEVSVWRSGALLRAAGVLVRDDHERGMRNLMAAREIIHYDGRLVLRSQDWWKVAEQYDVDLAALYEEAQQERTNGDVKLCLVDYAGVRTRSQKEGNLQRAALCLHMMGVAYYQDEHFDEAEKAYAQAALEFERLGDTFDVGALLRDQGTLATKQNRFDDAIALFEKSIDTLKTAGNLGHQGISEVKLGLALSEKNEMEKAEQTAREGIAHLEQSSEWYFLSNGHRDLGRILLKENKKEEAKAEFEKALAILREHSQEGEFIKDKEKLQELLQD